MRQRWRKAALTVHVVASLGWLGAVVVFLVLALAALRSDQAMVTAAGYVAMDLSVRFAIVPLAVVALLSGVVSSLASHWGLVRHWWVLIKLALVAVATVVLLLQLQPVAALADAAVASSSVAGGGSGVRRWCRWSCMRSAAWWCYWLRRCWPFTSRGA